MQHLSYYCDYCGHVFSTPERTGAIEVDDRDEHETDERCPRCKNPDIEVVDVDAGNVVVDNRYNEPVLIY
jgi:hypothetical protein